MIGTAGARLYVDNRNVEEKFRNSTPSAHYFSSYGIPSGNISIKTCPLGSLVALASINNLAISSSPNIIIPTNSSNAASLDIPLIAASTVGSICFIAMLTYFGYRFRSMRYQNISAREANIDSGGDDHTNNHEEPQTELGSPRRHRSRRHRSRRQAREDPVEPTPQYVSNVNLNEPAPQYVSLINLNEPAPIYVSHINLHDNS